MRLQPAAIRLGDQSWTVRPLTVAQVQAIEPLLAQSSIGATGTVASAVAILKLALRRDHSAAADSLDEVEAGAPEISAALADVLRLGGFIPTDDGPATTEAPGKSDAGAERSIGAGSTRD